MNKDGQTFYLDLFISLLHKIGSCSTLYFVCCYSNYLSRMKTNGSVYNMHLDFRGNQVCRFLCGFGEKHIVLITRWCNFRQQRSVLTQF